METAKERKNVKFGIILSYVNLAVSIIGSFFISNRVLFLIGDHNYGLFSFVNSITVWLTVISAALNSSFVRFSTIDAKEKEGDSSRINTIYFKLFAILGLAVLVLGLSTIAALYFTNTNFGKYDAEESKFIYILFALSIVNISLTIPSTLFNLFVLYKQRFIFDKLLTILLSVANFTGHILIAYFTRNVIYIAAYTIFITIVTFLFNFVYARKRIGMKFAKASLKENKLLLRQIVIFSGILVFNAIVDQINANVDKTLLGFFSIPEDVTIYQFGQQFNVYLVSMSIAVSSVFTPRIHDLIANDKQDEVNKLYLKVSKAQTIVMCLITFGFAACGYDFITIWIGASRINVYYVGLILMAIDICPLTLNSSIEIQRAKNKHLFRAIAYFAVAVGNIGLSILFLHLFPDDMKVFACLLGSVIARICSHWIAINLYNKKVIGLPVGRYMINLAIYFISSAIISGGILLLRFYVLSPVVSSSAILFIITGFIFVVLYGVFALILDRKFILQFIKRRRAHESEWVYR